MSQPHHAVLGAGPVGLAIATHLAELGHRPTVITRSGHEVHGAVAVACDVLDTDRLVEHLTPGSIVHHAAQPAYHRWAEEFPPIQASVVDACRRVGASLIAMENLYGYAPTTEAITERTPMAPTTVKGRVRARLWDELLAAHASGDIRVAAVRASDFFGPGVEGSAFGRRFTDAIAAGATVRVLGDPDRRHTVTYVPDVARLFAAIAVDPSAWGRAWHVPSAPAEPVRALVARAATIAGTQPTVATTPRWLLRAMGVVVKPIGEVVEMLPEFEHDFVMDDTDARRHFGLDHTDIEVALAASLGQPVVRS